MSVPAMPDDGRDRGRAAPPATLHLVIDGNAVAVRAGLRHLLTRAPLASLPDDARGTAEIVLAEVLNNIVEHAYARWPGRIALTIHPASRGVLCLVEDSGLPMPGGTMPDGTAILPDGGAAAGDRPTLPHDLPEGGFGWHLIRSLAQGPEYRRIGDRNRLTFSLPVGAPAV